MRAPRVPLRAPRVPLRAPRVPLRAPRVHLTAPVRRGFGSRNSERDLALGTQQVGLGLGFGVQGLGCRGLGFRMQGECRDECFGKVNQDSV